MTDTKDPPTSDWDGSLTPPQRRGRWRGIVFSLLVTVGLTAILFLKLDVDAFKAGLREADPWVIVAVIALHGLSWVGRALRWGALLRPVRVVETATLFRLVMIGAMISATVPARAGEFWRAHALGRDEGLSRSTVFGTIVVERVLDGLTVALLAAVAALALGTGGSLTILIAASVTVFIGVFAGLALFIRSEGVRTFTLRIALALTPGRLHTFVQTQFELFSTGLSSIRGGNTLVSALLLSFATCGIDAVAFGLLGWSFGFDVDPLAYLLVVAVGNLAVAIPVSIAGIGPFEFFIRQVLTAMGVVSAAALAYALLLHAVTLVFVMLAGLISLWSYMTRKPATPRSSNGRA